MRSVTSKLFRLALVTPAFAASPDNPSVIIERIYTHPDSVYAHGGDVLSPKLFTPRLRKLYALDREHHKGEVPNLDFDFLSNSQDPEVSQVTVMAKPREGHQERQTVTVNFHEMNTPETLDFDFVRQRGCWLIDEVRCSTPNRSWVLSRILEGTPK